MCSWNHARRITRTVGLAAVAAALAWLPAEVAQAQDWGPVDVRPSHHVAWASSDFGSDLAVHPQPSEVSRGISDAPATLDSTHTSSEGPNGAAALLQPAGSFVLWAPSQARTSGEHAAPRIAPEIRQGNRAGVPWIVAGAALVVGGAIVDDDAGTLLMAGGVGMTAYGLFIYF